MENEMLKSLSLLATELSPPPKSKKVSMDKERVKSTHYYFDMSSSNWPPKRTYRVSDVVASSLSCDFLSHGMHLVEIVSTSLNPLEQDMYVLAMAEVLHDAFM